MYEFALVLSFICFVAVTIAFVRSAAFSLFHPLTFYCTFHGFIFVFRPIVAHLSDFQYVYRAFQFTPSAADKLTVIFASNLGFLCFAAACFWTGGIAMRFKRDRISDIERERLKPVFLWIAALCIPIGVYSLQMVWLGAATHGEGYDGMVRDAGTGVFVNTKNVGYLMEAQLMLATCGVMLAWLFRFRLIATLPLLLFIVLRAGTGGRGPFVTALLTVGLLWLYEQRRRFPTVRVAALLAAVVLVFNTVGDDRGASIRRAIGQESTSEVFGPNRDSERWLEGMDFANMEYFEFLVYAVPQRSGTYSYFVGVLQLFTEPIPRVLWVDKPIGAPFQQIKLFDYGNPIGMTRSLPGEGWFSLGWFGVIVWCGTWGAGLGLIYRRYVEGAQNTIQTAAYIMFLPILIVAFRDGEIVTVFREGVFFIGPVLLWYLLARWLSIPSAAELRAIFNKRAIQSQPPATLRSHHAAMEDAALPAAVLRRRLALRRSSGEDA
jgi:hypothetical protein